MKEMSMSETKQHAPGSFCWIELSTSDQNAAKAFYSSLFGWTIKDTPIGPDQVYTIFENDGREAAAAYQPAPGQSSGAPPHWASSIAVASADESAARARELG